MRKDKIAIIGLGYVGLPLAVEFGKKFPVLGFDINQSRIEQLQSGHDSTLEVSDEELKDSPQLSFSSTVADLEDCNVYIVTVPTPIDAHKQPDLTPLIKASEMLGKVIKHNDIIIYESTVYPGVTEQICVKILEECSGLQFNVDFFCGYSPERINPGDMTHRLPDIRKVVAGSTPEVTDILETLYQEIIEAGVYRAESIRVAEAAKVIENTQRDLNIALVNELAMIFNKIGLDTESVLKAAETKWNFISFRPGLVGGHCIGVDPYYLAYLARSVGIAPRMINVGREINDSMSSYIFSKLTDRLASFSIALNKASVLFLGVTFKENCPDIRNSRVFDILDKLLSKNSKITIYDPVAPTLPKKYEELRIDFIDFDDRYDAILICVSHDVFKMIKPNKLAELVISKSLIFDLKASYREEIGFFRL